MDNRTNLNELEIENDGNFPNISLVDNSIALKSVDLEVFFRNQKSQLIKCINNYSCVVGCVAWLTDPEILEALANVKEVAIVVQKEDFLRPDINSSSNWKLELRKAYDKIQNNSQRFDWPGLMGMLSQLGDQTVEPIRCVGNHNSAKMAAFPRMHNKFLIFGKSKEHFCEVWTGSFNLTKNASMSLENAILIKNEKIASAYYAEFCQIFAISESLDWTSSWVEPEFRIGT